MKTHKTAITQGNDPVNMLQQFQKAFNDPNCYGLEYIINDNCITGPVTPTSDPVIDWYGLSDLTLQ